MQACLNRKGPRAEKQAKTTGHLTGANRCTSGTLNEVEKKTSAKLEKCHGFSYKKKALSLSALNLQPPPLARRGGGKGSKHTTQVQTKQGLIRSAVSVVAVVS